MNPYCRILFCFLGSILLALPTLSWNTATLDDLKKLEITYFVPSYLPKGFELKKVEITQEDVGRLEDGKTYKEPKYWIQWREGKRTFSIGCAADGNRGRKVLKRQA